MSYKDFHKLEDTEHETFINMRFLTDDQNRPAGGTASWTAGGFPVGHIKFQDGPIGEAGRNGGFVEDLLIVAQRRLEWYQGGEFKCPENAGALAAVELAMNWLNRRTRGRRERGVEGSHQK